MSANDLQSGDATGSDPGDERDPDVLAGELTVLREENERLREEYARARQSQYRQSAATLFVVGVLAFAGGVVVTDARTVLVALGGTGVFLGVLVYFVTPERFISASVGEAVYASLAHNESRAVAELGLEDEWVYVPRQAGADEDSDGGTAADSVRLFVPQREAYAVPDRDALGDLFVVSDDPRERGLSLRPTAADLYADFEQAVGGEPSDDPGELAAELGDAVVEQFELADSARADTAGAGRVALRVSGSAMGALDRIDHPVASLLGVGFAGAVGEAVTVAVAAADDPGDEYIVTCSWTTDDGGVGTEPDSERGGENLRTG